MILLRMSENNTLNFCLKIDFIWDICDVNFFKLSYHSFLLVRDRKMFR